MLVPSPTPSYIAKTDLSIVSIYAELHSESSFEYRFVFVVYRGLYSPSYTHRHCGTYHVGDVHTFIGLEGATTDVTRLLVG